MARIDKIEVVIADVPTIRQHVLAMATMTTQAIVLLFIRRDDGIVGVGEATTIGGLAYGEESPEGVKLAIETYFAPLLLGVDADRPAAAMALLDRHIVGNRFAKFGDQFRAGQLGVFKSVVQDGCQQGFGIHAEIGEDCRDRTVD